MIASKEGDIHPLLSSWLEDLVTGDYFYWCLDRSFDLAFARKLIVECWAIGEPDEQRLRWVLVTRGWNKGLLPGATAGVKVAAAIP